MAAIRNVPGFGYRDYGVLAEHDFTVTGVLGHGSFGVVIRAEWNDGSSGERSTYAIKAMKWRSSDDPTALIREANTGMVIQHFHVVRCQGYFADHGKFFLVMDYCPGGNLLEYFHNNPNASARVIRQFAQQLASAVHHVHHVVKLAHRDLKPENILLDGNRNIKLCDFGVAKCNITSLKNTRVGTECYFPPEMFATGMLGLVTLTHPECDPFKHDVWSYGVVVYLMVTKLRFISVRELERSAIEEIDIPRKLAMVTEQPVLDVLLQALNVRYKERATMCRLIELPWLAGYTPPPPPPQQ